MGYLLMENRHGRVVDARATQATCMAERKAAMGMVEALSGTNCVALGTNKAAHTRERVDNLHCTKATPHVAQNISRRLSPIDGRTIRHAG